MLILDHILVLFISMKALIGYLTCKCQSIRSGKTDDSIIYNEKVGNVDMMYGGIAVNISSYEDTLKL